MKLNKGFTLIELLVVIAILGVIAIVALLAIDPLEQLARSRDAGKLSTTAQLGHAVQGYATGSTDGEYPDADGTWVDVMIDSGELTAEPGAAAGGANCTTNAINSSWCYDKDTAGDAIVFAQLESKRNTQPCINASLTTAWAVYSTRDGRGGVVCTDGSEPSPGAQTFAN